MVQVQLNPQVLLASDWSILLTLSSHWSDTSNGEKVYEQWDCPKVEMVETNTELDLSPGDTANVLRSTNDGDDDSETNRDNIESSKL